MIVLHVTNSWYNVTALDALWDTLCRFVLNLTRAAPTTFVSVNFTPYCCVHTLYFSCTGQVPSVPSRQWKQAQPLVMQRARILVMLTVLLVEHCKCWSSGAPSKITLDSHFTYIILGGDHVAESIGRYLSSKDTNKTVLVLKGSRCNDVLEPSEPSKLWLEVSYLFAESAHYLGYEFIDPFLHGSKPGIAFTNQTSSFIPPLQQLYAVDPNLKMLTDARPQRIIYNKASSTALGVEVSINFESQYLFAKELIIAGRCLEDYQLLSQADILPLDSLSKLLNDVPLEIALKSPIIAPIFTLNDSPTISPAPPNKQPYCLLATELFIETLSKSGTARTLTTKQGIQPNAKVNIVLKEQPPHRWIGFNPSVIYQESAAELNDPPTIFKVLADTIEVCIRLGTSQTFQKLGLSLQPHQLPDAASSTCSPNQPDSVLCFVNYTLSTVYNSDEDHDSRTVPPPFKMEHLAEDFRLKSSRNLRLLPFGLTSPFLERWWKRIFSPRKVIREYTTRIGILRPDLTQFNGFSMEALLDKLRERLKAIESMPPKH
ncbi:uncharacterized protein LOC126568708 [Anopheles maculipalpis]|uniref:uncharacterized protein LOC126568708 n=1 Tax=Anopheles maculipalpis TaxID=1496333 RepID=UPI0021596FE5|nr:uncharacterized protein LOC126568708 [Anopheles maculipalpis]